MVSAQAGKTAEKVKWFWVNSSSPHLVKQGQCLEGLVGMGLLGDEGSPGDHILGPITGL